MITNKKIVITGASSGIGKAILTLLAKGEGNTIIAAARNVSKLEGFAPNVIPFSCDLSGKEGVDSLFQKIEKEFGYAEMFFCNAGAPYYEKYDYEDWDRIKSIFELNTIAHIYIYSKYLHSLNGNNGRLIYTVSAMGEMATPGFALYASSKFAMKGFQEGIRYELADNLKLTCVYPVSTNTNFFNVAADGRKMTKPFPVQEPETVAKAVVRGVEHGKKHIYPCAIFRPSKILMNLLPPVKKVYIAIEKKRLQTHLEIKALEEAIEKKVEKVKKELK